MSQQTAIEWTDVSWNPVHGCSVVSPGCAHCYAETFSRRYNQTPKPWTPANAAENVLLKPHKLREPLSNAKPWRGLGRAAAAAGKTNGQLAFVNSTSDLFHEEIPFEYIDRVFATMAAAQRHTFQVLTKRPERMLAYFEHAADSMGLVLADLRPWPNIWLGVSIENRRFVHRADLLRETPAAVRFISAEPLLGPLVCDSHTYEPYWTDGYTGPELDLRKIDWLIVGGESGSHARPMDPGWVLDLQRYNEAVSNDLPSDRAAFFFKQWGGRTPKSGGRELDGRTWDEFPQPAVMA